MKDESSLKLAPKLRSFELGTNEIVTTNNIEVDSTLNSNDPFLLINSTAETIDIGAPATKLKISNNAVY